MRDLNEKDPIERKGEKYEKGNMEKGRRKGKY